MQIKDRWYSKAVTESYIVDLIFLSQSLQNSSSRVKGSGILKSKSFQTFDEVLT